jgi:cytidine deaminase
MDLGYVRSAAVEAGGGWLPAAVVKRAAVDAGLSIDPLMLELIPLASEHPLPAVSGFRVGAIGQGESGALYFGANLEAAGWALNQTVHAEQATVINAWAHGKRGLKRLAVPAAPCGYCRQFLYELSGAADLEILLAGKPARCLASLLPGAFGPADLGIQGGTPAPARQRLECGDAIGRRICAGCAVVRVPGADCGN